MIGQDKKKNKELAQHTIKFFEKLLRASSDGIVITDAAHNIIVVNEAFCDFFGRQHREVIETDLFFWLEQLGTSSLKRWAEMESHVHSEGSCHDTEFTLMAHEGIKYLSVNASLMEKVGAEESGTIISIWRDITKQKRIEEELKILNKSLEERIIEKTLALIESNKELREKIAEQKLSEEALRTSESKYRLLLENLPQRIFYKNKDSMYISCNENYAGDIRIKPDEIRGKTDYDFFPKALAEKYRADDKRIMESGKAEEIEEKYVKDGQEYIIHTVKTPMKDEKGAIIGILGIFWDITEKIAMEKEAIRSRHLVSLGELAASVAHEVNNPITGVINYAQILCNKSTEGSKEKDIANRIIREGDRIASIVQSLLSFARISDKKEKKSIISVHEILSDTLILTKAQLRQEGIRIKLDIPQRLPEIVADPQQIQQVFLNAISNARYALNQKYPETHDNKILEVLGEEMTIDNQQCVKITFYDHGTGIPAEIRDKIMDPFFTTKPRGKGTGLGLSISQSIIQDHHGKLTIESIEGEFTKVAIIFPN
ncbi:PAS domain-containing sensor histidine kinase [Candidatus Jettenia sp. AMX1]|uniref:PAS domain-containing sensor histidine kinase n=1 Tax=Candidatus Jettenia sp. AMX1 TaxID=2293637 RepID=UPI0025569C5C|nr:PAS domain-containing sensor histidine kinase [Candidatus Jettenia sp. AMX1]MDL1937931.1 PAS domain S-box protein [Candidatus Jettenia sp. AMX1]